MKAIVTTTFEIDVTDWDKEEGLTKAGRAKQIKESLLDYSCFMIHFKYENLKKVNVKIK